MAAEITSVARLSEYFSRPTRLHPTWHFLPSRFSILTPEDQEVALQSAVHAHFATVEFRSQREAREGKAAECLGRVRRRGRGSGRGEWVAGFVAVVRVVKDFR